MWDTATQKPIGPAVTHEAFWPTVSFSPDGSQFLVTDKRGTAWLWDAPPGPIQGDQEQIVLWAQVVTGLQLDESGGIGVLDGPAWLECNEQLKRLGGPLTPAPLPASCFPGVDTGGVWRWIDCTKSV